jgi:hypothetical protein
MADPGRNSAHLSDIRGKVLERRRLVETAIQAFDRGPVLRAAVKLAGALDAYLQDGVCLDNGRGSVCYGTCPVCKE